MPAGMLQLGRLLLLEVHTAKDGLVVITPRQRSMLGRAMKGTSLAWGTLGRARPELHVCRILGKAKAGTSIPETLSQAHEEFHGASPTALVRAECPTASSRCKRVGLVSAIGYKAVGITSPVKSTDNWRHIFGDTGHSGNEDQPKSKMPELLYDGKSLFIRRRRGNTYTVALYDDGHAWIIG
jgi:hypothetical protein